MIYANFSSDGTRICLQVTGHAGAAPKGEDLVCAAVTALVCTAAQVIGFMNEQGDMKSKPEIRLEEGDAYVCAEPLPQAWEEALHTFFVIQAGIHVLAHNYPQYVKLRSFGRDQA